MQLLKYYKDAGVYDNIWNSTENLQIWHCTPERETCSDLVLKLEKLDLITLKRTHGFLGT